MENETKKAKIIEVTGYSLPVQIISFALFWLLPALWLSHLTKVIFNNNTMDIAVWIGLVILNLATYSVSRSVSATVNGYILKSLIVAQIYSWIFVK